MREGLGGDYVLDQVGGMAITMHTPQERGGMQQAPITLEQLGERPLITSR